MKASLQEQYGLLLESLGGKQSASRVKAKQEFLALLPSQKRQYIDNVVFIPGEKGKIRVWVKNSLISADLKMQEQYLRFALSKALKQDIKGIYFSLCHNTLQ
ncbi:MAG: hypothetical protein LBL67_05390 [Coriobacteriales bacterium]|jgi:hypothetical protein|nr:hypothetical protein [Coriobacteriales bacterium]